MNSGPDSFSVLSSTDTERKGGGLQEEIVVIDEEDDDMVVEATVRSIQMAEDEAFARSLQVSAITLTIWGGKDWFIFYCLK